MAEEEEEAFWSLESIWARIRVACEKSVLAALLLGILALSAAFAACLGAGNKVAAFKSPSNAFAVVLSTALRGAQCPCFTSTKVQILTQQHAQQAEAEE